MDYNINSYSVEDLLQLLDLNLDSIGTNNFQEILNNQVSELLQKTRDKNLKDFLMKSKKKILETYSFTKDDNDYSIEDMLLMINIDNDDDPSIALIEEKANNLIKLIPDKTESDIKSKEILINVKNKLINHYSSKFFSNNVGVPSSKKDYSPINRNNDQDNLVKREPLDKDSSFIVDVKKDTKLNPNIENVIEKTLIVDSTFREYSKDFQGYNINDTNPFTVDLPDPLYNVLSFRLYSLHLPMTWYNFTSSKGNTTFFITSAENQETLMSQSAVDYLYRNNENILSIVNESNEPSFDICNLIYIPVVIPNGKYDTIQLLIEKINKSIEESIDFYASVLKDKCQTEFDKTTIDMKFFFSSLQNKVYINIKKGSIRFFSLRNNLKIDNTLGWLLGFRKPLLTPDENNNVIYSQSIYNISDTKFVMIYIDDYLQNRLNTNILCTSDSFQGVKDTSYSKIPLTTRQSLVTSDVNAEEIVKETYSEKLDIEQINLIPGKPRNYSTNELYSFQQINSFAPENLFSEYRLRPPITKDAFAVIPLKGTSIADPKYNIPYIGDAGALQNIERQYFGPVNLRRMKITLIDDKGNLLDLNGSEWSFIIICKLLYSY